MKKLFVIFAVAAFLLTGCDLFDDSKLLDRIDGMEDKVTGLEELCEEMNANLSSLKTLVDAVENRDYITDMTPVSRDGKEIGYKIKFVKSPSIIVYHGEDGTDGEPVAAPSIGVLQDSDGRYYWTVDGEWLLDDSGEKIRVDGVDRRVPVTRIEKGEWQVSYDGGKTWKSLGTAYGSKIFKEIKDSDNGVTFVLADGAVVTVPKIQPLTVAFDEGDLFVMEPNSTREIKYTVSGNMGDVSVELMCSGKIKAQLSSDGARGSITVETSDKIDEYCKVIVWVSDDARTIIRTLYFEKTTIEVVDSNEKVIGADGGEIVLEYMANHECEVIMPADAPWLTLISSKAIEKHEAVVHAEACNGIAREAEVKIVMDDEKYITYSISQLALDMKVPESEIWYATAEGAGGGNTNISSEAFDANIIGHVFEDGYWKIRFDRAVTTIRISFGYNINYRITELLLPDSIENVEYLDGWCFDITELYVPESIRSISLNFGNRLERFYGHNVSEDGRCIIVKKKLMASATYGLEEYVIPEGVETIAANAFAYSSLKKVSITEGVRRLQNEAFSYNESLEEVHLPESIEEIDGYAFIRSSNIKRFTGPSSFVSDDGLCIFVDNYFQGYRFLIQFANGSGVTEYTVPEGIHGMENYAFSGCSTLQRLTLPSTLSVCAGGDCFENCTALTGFYGPHTSADNRAIVIDGIMGVCLCNDLTEYVIPDEVKYLGWTPFTNTDKLEKITMTDNVLGIDGAYGYLFQNCYNLREVTISARMENLGYDPFTWCPKLERVYCRAQIPPVQYFNQPDNLKFDNLKIYVPQESLALYQASSYWSQVSEYLEGYDYGNLPEGKFYVSTDYSRDGAVTTLQAAGQGNGIDLILMGDAFSDRLISDGTYSKAINQAYEAFFSEEPFRTYKDYFNVYQVDVVSPNDVYEEGARTAMNTWFGEGTLVGGADQAAFDYAQKAIGSERMNDALIVVMMNKDAYAGTCYMYFPQGGDYGSGTAVAYFPVSSDKATFNGLMLHEANGHGFAKLGDEYAYEDMGLITAEAVESYNVVSGFGWNKNVDLTSDPSAVKWSRFLNDSRYDGDGLGVFEGGLTYWTGVWRPTENSIMRYNEGGFNAPSREAMYYRIHKLAFGADWTYDYEAFVGYDAVNRTASVRSGAPYRMDEPDDFIPLAPPVIYNHAWNE